MNSNIPEKNIVIFFMSGMNEKATPKKYTTKDHSFTTESKQTNETGLKYIEWKLKKKSKLINHVFAIVTPKAKKEAWSYFTTQFKNRKFTITPIPTSDDIDMDSSFQCVNLIFDKISKVKRNNEIVNIHMDFTGGFRHSAMLLLALMQMLSFSGMNIGYVTYVNPFPTPGLIEEANELLNLFNITGGTIEFKSYGMSKGLMRYFQNQSISPSLRDLLNAMDLFSERIKVCSNIDDMTTAANELKKAIKVYENLIRTNPNRKLSSQEKFFNNLIPTIKNDYHKILKSVDNPQYPLELILWCLDKGLLQQAVTLYTQWLPICMFKAKLLSTPSKEIQKECETHGSLWKSWEIGFFRSYVPDANLSNNTNKKFTLTTLRQLLNQSTSLKKLIQSIPSEASQLVSFLKQAEVVINTYPDDNEKFIAYINNMKPSDLIKQALLKINVNLTPVKFLRTRLKNTPTREKFLLTALQSLSNDFLEKSFGMGSSTTKNMEEKRGDCFKNMIKQKIITSKLNAEVLAKIIDNYNDKIIDTRNTFSHANAKKPGDLETVMRQDIQILLNHIQSNNSK